MKAKNQVAKNVMILHGTGSNCESFWHPWLRTQLQEQGCRVWLPTLPNSDSPSIDEQLEFVLAQAHFDAKTILVGHSSGCPLILSILENIKPIIHIAILVAGFYEPLEPPQPEPMLQNSPFKWDRIKAHCQDFIFINSDNDPYACNDHQGWLGFRHLGGTLIIRHDGHFGSDAFQQPYPEFPLLLKLLLD